MSQEKVRGYEREKELADQAARQKATASPPKESAGDKTLDREDVERQRGETNGPVRPQTTPPHTGG